MRFGLNPVHIIAALIIGVVVLGPRNLPRVGAFAGRWIRDFREGVLETKETFVSEVTAAKPSPDRDQDPDALKQ